MIPCHFPLSKFNDDSMEELFILGLVLVVLYFVNRWQHIRDLSFLNFVSRWRGQQIGRMTQGAVPGGQILNRDHS